MNNLVEGPLSDLCARLPPIRISLTTIRSRLPRLPDVLQSLRDQSLQARSIFLAISEEPFALDEGITLAHLPRRILAMAEAGWLEIHFGPNTGPYRKLLPALHRYGAQEQLIATADDDTIYPHGWLEALIRTYAKTRQVVAHRCRAMTVQDGRFTSYRSWPRLPVPADTYGSVRPEAIPLLTLPTGVRGVLYNSLFFNDTALMKRLAEAAPLQDDLGFKAMMLCRGIGTVVAAPSASEELRGSFITPKQPLGSLISGNKTANDESWARLVSLMETEGLWRLSDVLTA